jgi:hypothetical protein
MLRRATSEPGQRAHDERIRQRVGQGHGRAGWDMTRRASLPGAAELFRATTAAAAREAEVAHHPGVGAVPHPDEDESRPAPAADRDRDRDAEADPPRATPVVARPARGGRRIRAVGDRAPSGRERHEEKITVYCSPEELLDLETARLQLRAEHGLAVDRGRIVREAVAVVLADLEAKGEASILVRRLRES